MPYVSKAQRGKFHAMEDRGEISHKTVAEWDKASKGAKLPAKKRKRRRRYNPHLEKALIG